MIIDFLDPINYNMKYLIVDGCLSGTGIRDKYLGGYVNPVLLGLSSIFIKKLDSWLKNYEDEFYNQYINTERVKDLDKEGEDIALLLKKELANSKIEYYSDAMMTSKLI